MVRQAARSRRAEAAGEAAGERLTLSTPRHRILLMSPTSERPAVRSAADINALMRALWVDGVLPEERRPEYERLVVEWAKAVRSEVDVAA